MPVTNHDEFRADLGLVAEAVRSGVVESYARKKDAHWDVWLDYCRTVGCDPHLADIDDPVPYLQVFAHRYRDGRIAPSGRTVKSQTVSDAVRSVGQRFSRMGSVDPRLDSYGNLDFRLTRQFRGYKKTDPAKLRVKPLPVCIVLRILEYCFENPIPMRLAVANMICIAFFFCLRPVEYTGTTTDDQAFSLNDITLYLLDRRLSLKDATDDEIEAATQVTYRFTKQKNEEEGVTIAHARSEHHLCCPVWSTIRQVLMHRRAFARFNRPFNGAVKLASYYTDAGKNIPVKASQVTGMIRIYANVLRSKTGIDPAELSARSLCTGGAMALLSGGCNSDIIKLLGC